MIDDAVKVWSRRARLFILRSVASGSGVMALLNGRKFIGCELKESYWRSAVRNPMHLRAQIKAGRYLIWQQIKVMATWYGSHPYHVEL